MTDFTISTLATTLAEGSIYSFSITPKTALTEAIKVRWEIVADGKLPISADDFASFTGVVDFAASATAAQTVSITATDDSALEPSQNFEIRIYQVVGDDDSTTSQTDDILLGAQAVRLDDNDIPTPTTPPTPSLFGDSTPASNAEGNVNTAANTQDFSLNAKGGNDTYIITRYQSGDVRIAESAGIDLIKFDYGVFIARFGEVSTSNFTRLKIEATILTLSTGAKIEIEFPDRSTSFQLGDGEIITSYAAFKTAIGASGTNATATFIAESYEVTTFATTPDVSANTIAVAEEVLESTGLSDVIGLGGVADVRANGAGGDDIFVITRFQTGDVEIDDTVGTNLIKFDFGVSITGFAEVSRISFGALTVSLATLTLSTGAEIEISFPAGAFNFQLGDDTVIETYAAFKTAIGASGTNAASTLAATHTVSHPTENFPTSGAVTITHAETSTPNNNAPNIGEVLTADISGITDADDATLTFTYQWKLDDTDISGATSQTYTPTAIGAYTVTVIATDSVTPATTVITSATAFEVINALPTGEVTVSGTRTLGEVLTADISTIADVDGLGSFFYQWLRGGEQIAVNAISATYTLVAADIGKAITVRAGYRDDGDSLEIFTSTNADTATTGTVTLGYPTGASQAFVGVPLTAVTSGLSDADDHELTFTYQWQLNGANIIGATAKTYSPPTVGAYSVAVTALDDVNNVDRVFSSAPITPTVNFAPTVVNPIPDQILTQDVQFSLRIASGGINAFADVEQRNSSLTYTLALTDGSPVPDWLEFFSFNESLRGTPTSADLGTISVRVTATDAGKRSAFTDVVIKVVATANNEPEGALTVNASASTIVAGTVLTANTSTIADDDGLGVFSYQWIRGGTEISGATNATYVVRAEDVNSAITLRVSYNDDVGRLETFLTTVADRVTTGTASITHSDTLPPTNEANVGETLTAVTSSFTDFNDDTLDFTYQWKLVGSETVLGYQSTYTPTAAGSYTVEVGATDSVHDVYTADFVSAAIEVL